MISVIVIGKNEGERLVACLKSIQTALSALAHEVVYVDSCSTDQSLQTAKALGARCFLLAERKTTAGLGRFVGAKEARGEYLLFLDGDMQLQPGFAEKALMAIAAKGYDGVCGIREDVYLRGGEVVCRNDNYFGCTQERLAPGFGGALMITRDALDACGGWATDTIACEEAELYARLKAIGCRIAEIPVPMILHTDAVRDSRSPLSTIFSARRLGEGQALACAMKARRARAYIRHEREKFTFYAGACARFRPWADDADRVHAAGLAAGSKAPARVHIAEIVFLRAAAGADDLSRAQPRLCGGIIRRETAV